MKGRDVFNDYAKRSKQAKALSLFWERKDATPDRSDEDILLEISDILDTNSKTIEHWLRYDSF